MLKRTEFGKTNAGKVNNSWFGLTKSPSYHFVNNKKTKSFSVLIFFFIFDSF